VGVTRLQGGDPEEQAAQAVIGAPLNVRPQPRARAPEPPPARAPAPEVRVGDSAFNPGGLADLLDFQRVRAVTENEARLAAPDADPPTSSSAIDPRAAPVQEVPVTRLRLSEDVPNFKEDADPTTGVVRGSQLEGQYERLGTAPIVAWERASGALEVITGRHRLDLARRAGEATIPTQVVREADGFTQQQARIFDAESNIRDGQGSTRDFARYFRGLREGGEGLTRDAAQARGLLARAKGRDGWDIGQHATDDLYSLFAAGRVNDAQAAAIARTAPGDPTLQRVGSQAALAGRSADYATNVMQAVRSRQAEQSAGTLDLFGADDSALRAAEEQARVALRLQKEVRERINAVRGASKRPELARELGVDVRDPEAVRAKLEELQLEAERWRNWPQHPDLVARTRGEEPPPAPRARPTPRQPEPPPEPAAGEPAAPRAPPSPVRLPRVTAAATPRVEGPPSAGERVRVEDTTPRFGHSERTLGPEVEEFLGRLLSEEPAAAALEGARRGRLSDQRVSELAERYPLTRQEAESLPQGTALPAEGAARVRAYAMAAADDVQSAQKAVEAATRLGDAEGVEAARAALNARTARLGRLALAWETIGSETGRALGLRSRAPSRTQAALLARRGLRLIMEDTQLPDGIQARLAGQIAAAGDDTAAIVRAVRDAYVPGWWEKFQEARVNFLIFNPPTVMRNLVGNQAAAAGRLVARAVGLPVDLFYSGYLRSRGRGDQANRQQARQLAMDTFGTMVGLRGA